MPGHYAVPVRSNKNVLLVSFAVLAGIGFGALAIYEWHAKQPAVPERTAPAVPAAEPKTVETPPPAPARTPRNSRKHHHPESADFVPPVLLTPPKSGATVVMKATAAPSQTPAPQSAPGSSAGRRAGVQDPGAGYSPMPLPLAPESTEPAANVQPVPAQARPAAAPQQAAQQPTLSSAPPAYAGPASGVATWTGKLGKNDILTITGGTPSTGILAGAGLPGVPVKVTIDQPNLGIVEMPSAQNGYRRLVLRSHSKHEKITIHWIANP